MVCIYCGYKTKTSISRTSQKAPRTWRRHRCTSCSAVFTSREAPDYSLAIAVNENNRSVSAFSPDKLYLSIYRSMTHRKSPIEDTRGICDYSIDVIARNLDKGAVDRAYISKTVGKVLKNFDEAAYIHYSAHHHC